MVVSDSHGHRGTACSAEARTCSAHVAWKHLLSLGAIHASSALGFPAIRVRERSAFALRARPRVARRRVAHVHCNAETRADCPCFRKELVNSQPALPLAQSKVSSPPKKSSDGDDFTENAVSPLLLRATREDTERLAERETLLHRLGSKLNRTVLNSCGNPIIRSANNMTFPQPGFFLRTEPCRAAQ